MSRHVLVVEDEAAIRDMLAFTLQAAGFQVSQVEDGEAAWQWLQENSVDLVLIDWMLPGLNGVELIERIRSHPQLRVLPLVMLTARGAETDQVEGFEAGADDYVIKPFSPRALVARLQAVLRRHQVSEASSAEKEQLRAGPLVLDLAAHRLTCDGREVRLGPTEFRLISFFMQHPDRVFSRGQLLDHVWGEHVVVEERTVDVHIRRLRRALEEADCPDCIETVRGVGYRLARLD